MKEFKIWMMMRENYSEKNGNNLKKEIWIKLIYYYKFESIEMEGK
jgi:hypothetical protein